MAISMISAAWALHAVVLIWLGLALRNRGRRVVGVCLFALAVAKVCFYDMTVLEPVYRILSFLASGGLALVAAYFYQRYVPKLLGDERAERRP